MPSPGHQGQQASGETQIRCLKCLQPQGQPARPWHLCPRQASLGHCPHLLALWVRTSAVCGGGFSVFTLRPGLTPGGYRDAANLKCSDTGEGRGTASSSRLPR